MGGSYTRPVFKSIIKQDQVNIVFELGSCHGLDAIDILETYHPSKIYSFECNPESIPVCKTNLASYPQIELQEFGVWWVDGESVFYATDMVKSVDKNIGASSFLCLHEGGSVQCVQKPISVKTIRLDTFIQSRGISKVDMICMDLQGVELKALIGLGDYLKHVKYVISEVLYQSYYTGDEEHADKLRGYLSDNGFVCTGKGNAAGGFSDELFVNTKIPNLGYEI